MCTTIISLQRAPHAMQFVLNNINHIETLSHVLFCIFTNNTMDTEEVQVSVSRENFI